MALPSFLFSTKDLLIISTLVLLVARWYIRSWRSKNPWRPMDWPLVGVLPSAIIRLHNFNDQITAVLAAHGRNIKAEGPVASGMRFFLTADPENVRHIFTTNHANYPKGEDFAEIFDIMRGSVFTVDGERCRQQRGIFQIFLSNPKVLALMASSCRDKLVNGLLPLMARMARTGSPFDIQDLMTRLIFDLTATPIFCVDPGRLSTDMPPMDAAHAMDTVMEVGLIRHAVPASCWKLMRRLNIGPERKLAVAHKQLHGFVTEMLQKRKEARSTGDEVAAVDIVLSSDPAVSTDGFQLTRTLVNYMVAGRDTIGTTMPWVFYNLATNPRVVDGIRNELAPIAARKAAVSGDTNNNTMLFFEQEETKDLLYLQAAIYESLRLYPPGPFERKMVLADDVLPSGHQLHAGETVLVSLYAMARIESVWGKDCREYVPERWVSDQDGAAKLRYVPSHKFLAFNSGPRLCMGKDLAIAQMKTIVAAVVWNFDVEVVQGQTVEPKLSCVLQIKDGLKVTVKKREACAVMKDFESNKIKTSLNDMSSNKMKSITKTSSIASKNLHRRGLKHTTAPSCCFHGKSWRLKEDRTLFPMDWPIVGMIPSILCNLHNFHDYLTAVLAASGSNFMAHGPVGSGMRFFFTCDPENIRHIFTSSMTNYPKGEEFTEIFDILSGTIFTTDSETWRRQRGKIKTILSDPRMLASMAAFSRAKVTDGLVPFLAQMASTGAVFDMQDLVTRFVFDMGSLQIFAVDPCSLSPSMPSMRVSEAMDTVMEVGFFRHVVPASCWKAMRLMNVGPERRLAAAHAVIHGYLTEMMEKSKTRRLTDLHGGQDMVIAAADFLTSDPEYSSDDLLLRKTLVNYLVAGRDTVGTSLPWVFYNLAKNPRVVAAIREELAPIVAKRKSTANTVVVFDPEETRPLVYLQAAMFESLRLYPPGPIERKTVLADDALPSGGHEVRAGDTVLIPVYAMGRMGSLWGEDCREYRPERWLADDDAKLRYVPSNKFMAFNTGPRTCLGKDVAIAQMKTVVSAVVWNFDLEMVEGQSVEPKLSCILQMKNGLKMIVTNRGSNAVYRKD
ncbi:hypothetical protein EJB05_08632, partial [Eragrostis curvula]